MPRYVPPDDFEKAKDEYLSSFAPDQPSPEERAEAQRREILVCIEQADHWAAWAEKALDPMAPRGEMPAYRSLAAKMPMLARALLATEAERSAAQREADVQLGQKLAAQITLKAVCDVLNLPMVSLGNGWTEATPKILARIEEIVDESERGFRERDAIESERAELAREVETRESQIATIKTHFNARCEHLTERNGELAREVEELRGALRRISERMPPGTINETCGSIARAALSEPREGEHG